jgi:hypothetical protein
MVDRRKQAKNIAELDHIKCKWLPETHEFRVTLDGLSPDREEAVAYYADDFQDAFETAQCMSKNRVAQLKGL